MQITNLGGATAIISFKGKRILFDPWMNEGILYGSWFHFPPMNVGLADIGRFDYIYISHIHEDHCAPGTLKHLNRDAEIIVMDREPRITNYITRFLKNYAFDFKKVHRVRPGQPLEIEPGLIVDMVEADPANEYNYLIDSGLILKWDGFTLYNANDCEPWQGAIDYINQNYGQVDLALLPYSGGSGYPGCYSNLTPEAKMAEAARLMASHMERMVAHAQALNPKRIMPFADQYVIGGNRYWLNQFTPHPACPGDCAGPLTQAGMADRILLLNSGQSFDLASQLKTPEEPYRMFSVADRDAYAEKLKDRPYEHEKIEISHSVPLTRLLELARKRMWDKQVRDNFFPDYRFYFDVSDRDLICEIDMSKPNPRIGNANAAFALAEPYLRLRVSATLLAFLLINHMSWNMSDYFIDYHRVPNTYDPEIYAYLNNLLV